MSTTSLQTFLTRTVTGMAKYVEREALIEWLKRIPLIDLSDGLGLCRVIMEDDFKKAIKKMPKGIIADVATVRHGRWTFGKDLPDSFGSINKNKYHLYCSECRNQAFNKTVDNDPDFDVDTPFCPWCGAKMDG